MSKNKYLTLLIGFLIVISGMAQNGASTKGNNSFDTNKNAAWTPIFPENSLGTSYLINADHQEAEKLFEVKKNSVKALYNWPDGKAPFGLISTVQTYSTFNVEFEYKWGKRKFAPRDSVKRDAGFLFHCTGLPKVWPSSLECQVQEGDTGDLWVIKGPKVTVKNQDGSKKEIDASGKKSYQRNIKFQNHEKKGWNHVRVEVRGASSARFFVNGHLVNELINFSKEGMPLKEGYLVFQAEGAEITYKNIRLQNLE